jgi:hypothetical protein
MTVNGDDKKVTEDSSLLGYYVFGLANNYYLPAEMHNIPEDLNLHQHCCENFKSHRNITVVSPHVIKTFKKISLIEPTV